MLLLIRMPKRFGYVYRQQVFIPGPVERRRASDIARDAAAGGADFVNPMSPLEHQCRRDGLVRMRDRKPRYDRTVSYDAATDIENVQFAAQVAVFCRIRSIPAQ